MAKTTVDLDPGRLAKVQEILGTSTIKETIDVALRRVVAESARKEFVEIAASGAFSELTDPEVERKMWA
ncbi:Arc/MetJ family transcription regulator [Stackebrandtia albiflava]|uniref:Arc/MetJ family transcription regulator n=1 Tax=Stackebrandtia albiflava TaxID=406432 RepID=A0A562V404_9ACTN|nr:type II toxin-antitoxin system VapB family antitoxin [Stackebrandtia albiflava]TWJ12610.1 Arc/MetJ family transcription regulator [Stackebrandtia albiflava]